MVSRLAIVISLLGMCLAAGVAPAAAAPVTAAAAAGCDSSGHYAPRVTTGVDVRVTRQGDRAWVTVTVRANDSATVTGTITVTTSRASGAGRGVAAAAARQTIPYDGKPVTLPLPTRPGSTYSIAATFRPSDTTTHTCSQGVATFTEGAGVDSAGPRVPTAAGLGGVLPNTGGPHALWLLVGMLLVACGGGTARYARGVSH